jgi:hypothetical protein
MTEITTETFPEHITPEIENRLDSEDAIDQNINHDSFMSEVRMYQSEGSQAENQNLSDSEVQAKFHEKEEEFTTFSHAMREALSDLYPDMESYIFKTEEEELALLTHNLIELNAQTRHALEIEEALLEIKENGRHRVLEILKTLRSTEVQEGVPYPHAGLMGDSYHIEGHQIDFYKEKDGKIMIRFKLTNYGVVEFEVDILPNLQEDQIIDGTFDFVSQEGEVAQLGDAYLIESDKNTLIHVAKGTRIAELMVDDPEKPVFSGDGQLMGYRKKIVKDEHFPVNALLGSVVIELDGSVDDEELVESAQKAFSLLNIGNSFELPTPEDESDYKEAQFMWHHKLSFADYELYKSQQLEDGKEPLERLRREEVFPGYHTFVDLEAQERYNILSYWNVMVYHSVRTVPNLVGILKNGLMSSLARYSSGLHINGISTRKDFDSGGADSVFLRYIPRNNTIGIIPYKDSVEMCITFDPSILNRLDWYCYNKDLYGSTEVDKFSERQSPSEFIPEQSKYKDTHTENEIMVRRGISANKITGVFIGKNHYAELIRAIKDTGADISEFEHLIHGVENQDEILQYLDNSDMIKSANQT